MESIYSIKTTDFSIWNNYSANGKNGNFTWFGYYNGNIDCKNPDDEIINKMVKIAIQLDAKVQGDEGVCYPL